MGEAYGGSSGGGSINIFYRDQYMQNGNLDANGGTVGGNGGTGSISVGQIVDGSYVSTYKNY